MKTGAEIRAMTKEERAKWQFEEATKRNELRGKHQREHEGWVTPEKEEKKKKL